MQKKTLRDKVMAAISGPKAAGAFVEFLEKIGAFKEEKPQEKKEKTEKRK